MRNKKWSMKNINYKQGGGAMKLKPIMGKIIVERHEEEEVKQGGIIIPDTAKEKPLQGIVVAVDENEEDMPVKVGDKILFGKYSGNEVEFEGKEYIVMNTDDILAIIAE